MLYILQYHISYVYTPSSSGDPRPTTTLGGWFNFWTALKFLSFLQKDITNIPPFYQVLALASIPDFIIAFGRPWSVSLILATWWPIWNWQHCTPWNLRITYQRTTRQTHVSMIVVFLKTATVYFSYKETCQTTLVHKCTTHILPIFFQYLQWTCHSVLWT